jgi:hypothetical protein
MIVGRLQENKYLQKFRQHITTVLVSSRNLSINIIIFYNRLTVYRCRLHYLIVPV